MAVLVWVVVVLFTAVWGSLVCFFFFPSGGGVSGGMVLVCMKVRSSLPFQHFGVLGCVITGQGWNPSRFVLSCSQFVGHEIMVVCR